MSFLASLLTWANVPFTIALGIALTFGLLSATGLLGLLAGGGDHDGDAGGDHDVGGDAHAEGHAEAHADGDHDADGEHDGDSDSDHDHDGGGGLRGFAGALGVGKVPMSIIWQTYAVSFALAGMVMNTAHLSRTGTVPTHTLLWTMPLALAFGFVVTRTLSGFLGKLLSNPAQQATSRRELVGATGIVISSKINAEFGEVRIQDKSGHVVRVICTTQDAAPIAEGQEVVVVEYDRERDRLYVAPLEQDESGRKSGVGGVGRRRMP